MSIFDELKRRNVFRVGIAYVVAAWVIIEVSSLILDIYEYPDSVMKLLVALLALGLPFVLFFAWVFEVTPDGIKRDNHTNPHGFRDEGDAFFDWLSANGFLDKSLYIVCGDRHWQYHSIHPEGFEEFSVGAVVDANSRLGRKPGDPESTDPEGLIYQPYLQEERSGGFLEVTVRPPAEEQPATAEFAFYDEKGTLLYTAGKAARP